ncbi:MAG: GH39 family glycosyl hydrolase [Bryobacteraceae bacterium]
MRRVIELLRRASVIAVSLLAVLGMAMPPKQLIPPQQIVPETDFGMQIHGIEIPRPNTGKVTPWPSVRFAAWRLHDAGVTWRDLEPKKGEFQFARLDRYVALAEQKHVAVLLPLVSTPAWASSRPHEDLRNTPKGSAAEPLQAEDWRNFVRTVVERYRGRIEAYEIWNEPNVRMFWTGSVDQLVALTRDAYRIIKGIDAAALVVLPSATTETGPQYLDAFLRRGGAQYGDVVGYHFYVHANPPEAMAAVAERVKSVLRANNVNKSIWNTEAGWDQPRPFPSDELAAAYVARSYLLLWASGVTRSYWYAWDNHGWVSLEMTESDNVTLKPAAKAYATIEHWLTGAAMRSCKSDAAGNWVCELERDRTREWIIWNSERQGQFSIPADWRITHTVSLLGPEQRVGGMVQIGPCPMLLEPS